MFSLTKFVPWVAYSQDLNDTYKTFEQDELVEILEQQSTDNSNQIDLETAIQVMADTKEIKIKL